MSSCKGGAIYLDSSSSTITIMDSAFTSNSSGNSGGAIYTSSAYSYLRNVKFTSNAGCSGGSGSGYGGALANDGGDKTHYWELYDIVFSSNTCTSSTVTATQSLSKDVYSNNGNGDGILSYTTCDSSGGMSISNTMSCNSASCYCGTQSSSSCGVSCKSCTGCSGELWLSCSPSRPPPPTILTPTLPLSPSRFSMRSGQVYNINWFSHQLLGLLRWKVRVGRRDLLR